VNSKQTEAGFDVEMAQLGVVGEKLAALKTLYDPAKYPFPADRGNFSKWWWTTTRCGKKNKKTPTFVRPFLAHFSALEPPHTRHLTCSTQCPCLSGCWLALAIRCCARFTSLDLGLIHEGRPPAAPPARTTATSAVDSPPSSAPTTAVFKPLGPWAGYVSRSKFTSLYKPGDVHRFFHLSACTYLCDIRPLILSGSTPISSRGSGHARCGRSPGSCWPAVILTWSVYDL